MISVCVVAHACQTVRKAVTNVRATSARACIQRMIPILSSVKKYSRVSIITVSLAVPSTISLALLIAAENTTKV